MYGQKYGPKLVKAAQNREEQEWKNVEPKLENDRRLRGIHFRHPTVWPEVWRTGSTTDRNILY